MNTPMSFESSGSISKVTFKRGIKEGTYSKRKF
jgi:hypothetical protein